MSLQLLKERARVGSRFMGWGVKKELHQHSFNETKLSILTFQFSLLAMVNAHRMMEKIFVFIHHFELLDDDEIKVFNGFLSFSLVSSI